MKRIYFYLCCISTLLLSVFMVSCVSENDEPENPTPPENPEVPENPDTPEDPSGPDGSKEVVIDVFSAMEYDELVAVEGGTFMMGATSEQGSDAEEIESPTHRVTLGNFYISRYEVTQEMWEYVMNYSTSNMKPHTPVWPGDAPSTEYGKGERYPAYNVSYDDIINIFIPRLRKITGRSFRLPTEAEWEFAARGGNKTKGYKYSGNNNVNLVAWHVGNSSYKCHEVGLKHPNELGLYDMSGNVFEWCYDWYDDYSEADEYNPYGPSTGEQRVMRGGAYDMLSQYSRVSYRCPLDSDVRTSLGFRLAYVTEIN